MKTYMLIIMTTLFSFVVADNHGKVNKFSAVYLTKPAWTKEASYKDSHYQGPIVAECQISALKGGGLAALNKFFKGWIEERAVEQSEWKLVKDYFDIKKDGKNAKLDALSRRFISHKKDDEGELKILLTAYIGYEPGKRFIYYAESESIQKATDNKQRVKTFQGYYRFTKAKNPGYYNVYIWRYYKMEGYWYEPTGIFTSTVREKTMNKFQQDMDEWFKIWADEL